MVPKKKERDQKGNLGGSLKITLVLEILVEDSLTLEYLYLRVGDENLSDEIFVFFHHCNNFYGVCSMLCNIQEPEKLVLKLKVP